MIGSSGSPDGIYSSRFVFLYYAFLGLRPVVHMSLGVLPLRNMSLNVLPLHYGSLGVLPLRNMSLFGDISHCFSMEALLQYRSAAACPWHLGYCKAGLLLQYASSLGPFAVFLFVIVCGIPCGQGYFPRYKSWQGPYANVWEFHSRLLW